MDLDVSKVHKDSIMEYIYNKLYDEQLYQPFIDIELERRIKRLCEDVYIAGYKDGQETEKLQRENEMYDSIQKAINIIDKLEISEYLSEKLPIIPLDNTLQIKIPLKDVLIEKDISKIEI